MAIPLRQLIENPDLAKRLDPSPNTSALYERTPHDGWQPTDRYYEELGAMIEKYPIVSGRVRRR